MFLMAVVVMQVGCESSKPAPATTDVPHLHITHPTLELGAGDELMHPASATRLSSGVIVVADAYRPGLLFFDFEGRLIRSVGRRGYGPGEYQGPGWISQCEKGYLYVLDGLQNRMTVLDTAGTVVRQVAFPRSAGLTCHEGLFGLLIPKESPTPINLAKPRRERLKSAIELQNAEGDVTRSIEGAISSELGPLGKQSAIAITTDGVWFGSGDSSFLELYSHRGRHLRTVGYGIPLRQPTNDQIAKDIERIAGAFADKATRDFNYELMRKFDGPRYLPAFSQMKGETTGRYVWVNTSFPGDTITKLRAISGKGAVVADITLPKLVRVLEIGSNYVLGAYDADGQPRVVMYTFGLGARKGVILKPPTN
jgi:hypothetical protein